jgi:hypothetical protein
MRFLAPTAFIFALALPTVVLFYLLKRKRVVRVVSSTLLWQRFLSETQASAPFQKLRHHWLMVLQLLLLALVVLAIARPYSAGRLATGALNIIVLDASASMQATDEKPTRFDKAKKEILELIDSLSPASGGQMVLMVAGATAEVRQSATSDKSSLRRSLAAVKPGDTATHLTEALRVADSLAKSHPGSEVHLFSDGIAPGLDEFGTKDLPLVYHKVGQRSKNAGVIGLEVRPNPENAGQRAVFASIANNSLEEINTTIELLFDGELVDTKPLNLAATNTGAVVFIVSQPRDGVFTVRLNYDDDLAVDNTATVPSRLPAPVRIALVTAGNRFLQRALASASPLAEVAAGPSLPADAASYDIVVLDNIAPPQWPTANMLAIHAINTNWFEGGVQTLEAPTVVDWRNTHPLLRFVTFDDVQIAEAYSVKPPIWATPLVDAGHSPLIFSGELGRQRVIWTAFDTLHSTWPLRISFPIFIANCVEWLNPATARAERFQVKTGEPIRLPIPSPTATATTATVTLPDGTKQNAPIAAGASELVFGETGRQGVYRIDLGTNQFVFCANLLDQNESDLQPRAALDLGRRGQVAATTTKPANLEIWRWFALAGLGILMFEWWWFHRRTA